MRLLMHRNSGIPEQNVEQRISEQRLNEPVLNFARQDYVRVGVDQTVGDALASVQSNPVDGRIIYFGRVDRLDEADHPHIKEFLAMDRVEIV